MKTSHLAAHFVAGQKSNLGRVAIVVSRKHGGAVQRNRIRRRIREGLRQAGGPPPGVNAVLVARPGVTELAFTEVRKEIIQIMEELTNRKTETS